MRPFSLAYSVERRVPASCLLITGAVDLVGRVYTTLQRGLGFGIWVWYEPAIEPAVRVLHACRFRLILLDTTLTAAFRGSILRAIKDAAPETPLILLVGATDTPLEIERAGLGTERARVAGAAAVVPRGDPTALELVVRQILTIPVPSNGS